jgi:hypothetical protein
MLRDILGAIVCLLAMLNSDTAHAHADRMFTIAPNGDIQGFPADYGQASLQLGTPSREAPEYPSSVVVRIGAHETHLPRCIRALLAVTPIEAVQSSGSWHHEDFSKLPPYLVFEFPRNRNQKESDWVDFYELIFDMTNARLLDIARRASSGARVPAKVEDFCTTAEQRGLVPSR